MAVMHVATTDNIGRWVAENDLHLNFSIILRRRTIGIWFALVLRLKN